MNFNHLSRQWMLRLHILYIAVDIAIIAALVLLRLDHAGPNVIAHWGLTTTAAAVVLIHLLYGTIIYPVLQRRYPWTATVISQILFDLNFAALINNSNYNNLVYRFGWIATVGLSATLGIFMALAEAAIDAFLNVLSLIGIARPSTYGALIEWLFTAAVACAGILGWLILSKWYTKTHPDDSRLSQLNRQLAQAQLESNLVFQSISDGVLILDTAGKITAVNQAAATLIGWNTQDAVGLDVHLVMKLAQQDGKPLPAGTDFFNQVLKQRERITETVQFAGQANKLLIISLVISPIVVNGRELVGAVAVFRDVTAEYQEQQQRAEFISTASHEMRTPVAAIEGYLSLALNDKVSTIDSKARGYLEKAHESTQHLGKLFQDLLTSAKAEDGRISNHPVVVEIGSLLQKVTEDIRFAAEKKQLGVEFLYGNNGLIDARQPQLAKMVVKPLYYVHVDPDRLREVITNLFDNAVKYTEAGQITIGLTGDDSIVQIYIRDTGVGIPSEDIPHLFQKFYRVDSSATRVIGGTGLGLFICRKIIELYHGRIWVESKLGEGSTFYINLPRLTAEKVTELQAQEALPTATP